MLVAVVLGAGAEHVDQRCSCRCPEAETLEPAVNIDWPGRKIYINSSVSPTDCDCEHVVQPVLGLDQVSNVSYFLSEFTHNFLALDET